MSLGTSRRRSRIKDIHECLSALLYSSNSSNSSNSFYLGLSSCREFGRRLYNPPAEKPNTTYFCICPSKQRMDPVYVKININIVFHSTSNPTVPAFVCFLFCFCLLLAAGLFPACFGAAVPVSCGSIYKSFAQCLVTLGDSLVETEKDQNAQDIDAICRCALKKPSLT